MKIEQIMTRKVRAIGPEESLDIAARLMWENDCGSLPVVDDQGRVLAMITDRDLCMAAWSQGRPLRDLAVRSCMSNQLYCCGPHEALSRAERLMQEHQVHRLPIVDDSGRLLGIVSLGDIAREALHEHGRRPHEVGEDEVGRTFAAVSRPRACRLPAATPPGAVAARALVASG